MVDHSCSAEGSYNVDIYLIFHVVNLFCSYDIGFVKAPSENGSQKIFDTKTVRNQINDVVIDIAFNMIPKQSRAL